MPPMSPARRMRYAVMSVLLKTLPPARQLAPTTLARRRAGSMIRFGSAMHTMRSEPESGTTFLDANPDEYGVYRNRCGGITYKFCARVEKMSSVAD